MSLSGYIAVTVIQVPLLGRKAFQLLVIDESGLPVDLTTAGAISVAVYRSPDSASALFTKTLDAGVFVATPETQGVVEVVLNDVNAALLSAQQLYSFVLSVTDETSSQVIAVNMGYLMPMLSFYYRKFAVVTNPGEAIEDNAGNPIVDNAGEAIVQ